MTFQLKVIDENTEEVQNEIVEEIAKNEKIEVGEMLNDDDFFNILKEKNRIDGNKINYKLGDLGPDIGDCIKMETYNDWLLKNNGKVRVIDLIRVKMEELALKELKNYPLEYVEFVARDILNIPFEEGEIEERYRLFRKAQRKEEKENYAADVAERKALKERNKYLIKTNGEYIIELN